MGGFLLVKAWQITRVPVSLSGLDDEASLTAEEAETLAIALDLASPERAAMADLSLDGRSVLSDATVEGRRIEWAPGELTEGEHRLDLRVPRPLLPAATLSWSFTVDATAPLIEVPSLLDPVAIDRPVIVRGTVEPDAELRLGDTQVETTDGSFELRYDIPPAGPLELIATDPAGNTTSAEVIVPVVYPGCRGVHVSAAAWADRSLRAGIVALIDEGRVNCVELDLKDEGGTIGHTSAIPMARRVDASQGLYDLGEVVAWFHSRNLRVIGRLVAFRDPLLTRAMWDGGHRDMVVQRPDGSMFPAYGDEGFANFAHPEVWRYNVDIALEAAAAGVDEILYDYVRRPEGALEGMVIPGLEATPSEAIVDFLTESHGRLRAAGVYQGASLFGIAASRPEPVAQDVGAIARHVDFVSPLVYPSLWVDGEYRVESPVRQPYDIVSRSLEDFQEDVAGTGVALVPWLQDFTLGLSYGPVEVRAQIDAARDRGIDDFLLWDPRVTYTAGALDPS